MDKHFSHHQFLVIYLIIPVVFCCLSQEAAHAQHGWQSGKIKADSRIQIQSQYSDNIFHNDHDQQSDLITKVLPQIELQYAFSPYNTLAAEYKGDFRDYKSFDNFAKTRNYGQLFWQWSQPLGSKLEVGSKLDDASIQPYSEEGRYKDYLQWQLYLNSLLKIGSATESELKLETSSREFDDNRWAIDDYNRYGLTYDFVYRKWPFTSFTFGYSYFHQENNEFNEFSTDMDVHSVMVGPRWETGQRLTGLLQGGYSKISGDNFSDSSVFLINANLGYTYSDVTTFKLTAYRQFDASTKAARESNIYNVATGGTFTTVYSRWDPLQFTLALTYRNKKFEGIDIVEGKRTDDYYQASLKAEYSIRQWLSLNLQYQYREKDSNLETVEYHENKVTIGLTFSI